MPILTKLLKMRMVDVLWEMCKEGTVIALSWVLSLCMVDCASPWWIVHLRGQQVISFSALVGARSFGAISGSV
jgi:hypothetical protein